MSDSPMVSEGRQSARPYPAAPNGPVVSWADVELSFSSGELPEPKPLAAFAPPREAATITAQMTLERDAFDWADLFAPRDEHGLPEPRCLVASYGDQVLGEQWFRSSDGYVDDAGDYAVSFGSFEVDEYDDLYVDHGGEG